MTYKDHYGIFICVILAKTFLKKSCRHRADRNLGEANAKNTKYFSAAAFIRQHKYCKNMCQNLNRQY